MYQQPPSPPLLQQGPPLGCSLWLYGMYLIFGLCWTFALTGQAWSAFSSGQGNVGYLTNFIVILWLFAVPGIALPVFHRIKRQEFAAIPPRLRKGLIIVLAVLVSRFPVLGSTVSASIDLALVLALLIGLFVAFVRLRPLSETSGTATFDEMKQVYNRYEL